MINTIKTTDPYRIFAATLWGEARGEGLIGQIAVACVIRNRKNDRRWPGSYKEVCLQKYQFSCWLANDPNLPKMIERLNYSIEQLQKDHIFQQCLWIAQGFSTEWVMDDITKGANHYLNPRVLKKLPSWALPNAITVQIGNHNFYKL